MKNLNLLFLLFSFQSWADCSPKDLTDPAYLRSVGKENLIEHFQKPRDQDGVGWCGAFAPADALTFAINEPVSAIDVSIQQYASEVDSNGKKLNQLSGVVVDSASKVAESVGYCPESVIPSDQTSSSNLGHYAILNLMTAFQKVSEDYNSKGRPKDYCVKCNNESYEKVIRPALPNISSEMITEVLNKNQGDALLSLSSLLKNACDGKRVVVKTDAQYVPVRDLRGKTVATALSDALDNDIMPNIVIHTSNFARPELTPGGGGPHDLTIVGKRLNAEGKCEFEVRNSWGRGCEFYQDKIAKKCDPKRGSFWMDQDQLQAGVSDLVFIKKSAPPKYVSKYTSKKENSNQDNNSTNTNSTNNSNRQWGEGNNSSSDSSSSPIPSFDSNKIMNTISDIFTGIGKAIGSIFEMFSNFFKY